jgi:hypothetical protein
MIASASAIFRGLVFDVHYHAVGFSQRLLWLRDLIGSPLRYTGTHPHNGSRKPSGGDLPA